MSYNIEALLNKSTQPFKDLSPDTARGLAKSIAKDGMVNPVLLSSDGILFAGHQRLKALLKNGETEIDDIYVKIVPGANEKNLLEYAIRDNVMRRHLSLEEKAELARDLKRNRRWSQAKIAEVFGVSRQAVTQWFAKTKSEDDEDDDVMIEGVDGKLYTPVPKSLKDPDEPDVEDEEPVLTTPWSQKGKAYKTLQSAKRVLQHETSVDGLTAGDLNLLNHLAQDVIEAATVLVERIQEAMDLGAL